MSKIMLVTMGTSLFSSASWEPNKFVLAEIKKYKQWLESRDIINDPGPLISPEKRMKSENSREIIRQLEESLTTENADKWAEYFAPVERNKIKRYSAELTTIFELGFHKNEDDNLKRYLDEFASIFLVADPDLNQDKQHDRQYIAALHTKRYLEKAFNLTNIQLMRISGLSSKDPKRLIGDNKSGLYGLVQKVEEIIDNLSELWIITSGGYKIYGVMLGRYASKRDNVSIVYLHEKGDEVFIYDSKIKALSTITGKPGI